MADSEKKSNMTERIISGVVLVVFIMAVVWLGGIVLAVAMALISAIANHELIHATGVKEGSGLCIFDVVGGLVIVLYYLLIYMRAPATYLFLLILLYLILLMLLFIFSFPKYTAVQIIYSYFSFLYGPVMLSCVLMCRMLFKEGESGIYTLGFFVTWMIFISAWASDTAAYFVGVTLGKHKIAPSLSPKKSLEGCIGGVVGAALAGLLYGAVITRCGYTDTLPLAFLLLGAAGSVVGQIGDLAASGIKRYFHIKDYGNLIPGHGGILDRFDSVLFTAPLMYLLVLVVIVK